MVNRLAPGHPKGLWTMILFRTRSTLIHELVGSAHRPSLEIPELSLSLSRVIHATDHASSTTRWPFRPDWLLSSHDGPVVEGVRSAECGVQAARRRWHYSWPNGFPSCGVSPNPEWAGHSFDDTARTLLSGRQSNEQAWAGLSGPVHWLAPPNLSAPALSATPPFPLRRPSLRLPLALRNHPSPSSPPSPPSPPSPAHFLWTSPDSHLAKLAQFATVRRG